MSIEDNDGDISSTSEKEKPNGRSNINPRPFRNQPMPGAFTRNTGHSFQRSQGNIRSKSPTYNYGPDGSVVSVRYPERPRTVTEFELGPPGVRQSTRPQRYNSPVSSIDNAQALPVFYRGPNIDPSKALKGVSPSQQGIAPRRQMGPEEAQALLLFREYMMRCEFEEVDPDIAHKDFLPGAKTKEIVYRWIQLFLQLGLVRGYHARKAYLTTLDNKDGQGVEYGPEVTNWSAVFLEDREKKRTAAVIKPKVDEQADFALPGYKDFDDVPKTRGKRRPMDRLPQMVQPLPRTQARHTTTERPSLSQTIEDMEDDMGGIILSAHRIVPEELPIRKPIEDDEDDCGFFEARKTTPSVVVQDSEDLIQF